MNKKFYDELVAALQTIMDSDMGFLRTVQSAQATSHMATQFPLNLFGTTHALQVNGVLWSLS